MYYNNFQLEARPSCITKIYIRVLHLQALSELQKSLGAFIGLGISSSRPTKQNKSKYCTINGTLNSVELPNELPAENIPSLLKRTVNNSIDFIYSSKSRQLSCTIRFTQLRVSSAEVVLSRAPSAEVKAAATSAYVGAWFLHDGAVLEIVSIENNRVACKTPDSDDTTIELPLELVCDLVNRFGCLLIHLIKNSYLFISCFFPSRFMKKLSASPVFHKRLRIIYCTKG
jgi:hypothetical protein